MESSSQVQMISSGSRSYVVGHNVALVSEHSQGNLKLYNEYVVSSNRKLRVKLMNGVIFLLIIVANTF